MIVSDPLTFSSVFSFEDEENKFLANKKKSIVNNFKFTVELMMQRTYSLAFWLHVFKRHDEAITVCDFLMQKEFNGDNNLWYHVDKAIGLKYIIEKQFCDYPDEHYNYVNRIFEAQEENIRLRSVNEQSTKRFRNLYEGFMNGQVIESELWRRRVSFAGQKKSYIEDECYSIIRELCWLITVNEFTGRETFTIGGQSAPVKLFWDKYNRYMAEIRCTRKIDVPDLVI